MDFPPPLPPSLPHVPLPPPTPPAKKGMSGCSIALIVGLPALVIIAILAALAVPAFRGADKFARETAKAREAARAPTAPLTEQQKVALMKFAHELSDAILKGDGAAILARTSGDAIAERTAVGTSMTVMDKRSFKTTLNNQRGGLLHAVLKAPTRPMRIHERDGFPAITMRVLPATGGVNFFDLLVKPDGDSFKLVDLYGYLFGNFATADAREAMMLMQSQDAGALTKMLRLKEGNASAMKLLGDMYQKKTEGDMLGAHNDYEKLPREVQKSRAAFVSNLQALQTLQHDPKYTPAYLRELESAKDVLGKATATDMLLLDFHFLKGDFKAAETCVQNTLNVVGEDAFLYHLMGMAAVKDNDFEKAADCLAAADKLEPELVALIDLRLQVMASQGDFAGMIKKIEKFAKDQNAILTEDIFAEPVYAKFRQSPEYAAWAKSLKR